MKNDFAGVAELVDAVDLGSTGEFPRGGSSPPSRTLKYRFHAGFRGLIFLWGHPGDNCWGTQVFMWDRS